MRKGVLYFTQHLRGVPQSAASLSIPGELAVRADFLARLHHESGLGNWAERVLRERVDLEEFAFREAKKNLTP